MLKQRVITAVVLLLVLLPALFASDTRPFFGLTLLFIAAAGWEWARLNGAGALASVGFGAVVAAGGMWAWSGAGLAQLPGWLWSVALMLWVAGGAFALRGGVSAWPRLPVVLRLSLGPLLLWLAWLAMAEGRTRGLNFLLSTFCLVWMADIAAYFGGRAWGRRKLAPAISPGKSWAGVYTGMVGVLVLGAAWMMLDASGRTDGPSLHTLLWQRLGPVGWLFGCLFLAAMSVVGDLFESLIKRSVGAKDSSGLLPGHGGVLDRIDALLPVCPLALALIHA